MNVKELKQIVTVCRKNGILRLKTSEFEIELDRSSFKKTKVDKLIEKKLEEFPAWDSLPEEARLLYSSPPLDA